MHERNYLNHDLELARVAFVLKIWRHYFYGMHYEIFIDHCSLQYLMTQRELNAKQCRWKKLFKDYDISIWYHPGKANMVVDALSQKAVSKGNLASILVSQRPLA